MLVVLQLILIFFTLVPSLEGEECIPDVNSGVAAKGVLVPPEQCESFRHQLANETDQGSRERAVCCPVFQNEPNCGRVSEYDGTNSFDSRETYLDQFPWAVVITLRRSRQVKCSGSLITREFVLSAAHCYMKPLKNHIPQHYRVHLGEWDLDLDRDCMYVRGRLVCNEHPPLVIPVENIVNHPQYRPNRRDFLHDIALLKLSRPVVYSNVIAPACLPGWSSAEPAIAGQSLTATGWGKTRAFLAFERKNKLAVTGRNVSYCQWAYHLREPVVPQVQLCVGGVQNRDMCFGDSGCALMRRDEARWTQVGVLSFGPDYCGKPVPSVYTNVAWYLDWIQRTIEDTSR